MRGDSKVTRLTRSRGSRQWSAIVGLVLSVTLVTGVLAVVASPASASPTWSIAKTPNPRGPQTGTLTAVACASTTSCVAVGDTFNRDNPLRSPPDALLAQRWNGSSWSVVSMPKPSGSSTATFGDVACATSTSCFAVGFAFGIGTLVEQWNGTSWSIVASPNPPGSSIPHLNGVSCVSATNCFAVGQTDSFGTSLVEQWNGASWSIVASPDPAGSINIHLDGVSCVSATSCFAVGAYSNSTATTVATLVEQWDGLSWSIVASPNPTGDSRLRDVSCVSATSCFAVGNTGGAASTTLAEQWNGTSWTIVSIPKPAGADRAAVTGVWCPSATNCVAVGSSVKGQVTKTLLEYWNGTSWSIVAGLQRTGSLNGASCPSTTSCFAVGGAPGTFIERRHATSWSIAAAPLGGSQSGLQHVSCPSATSCFAVGTYFDGSVTRTLVERRNPTSWSVVTSPNRSGSAFNSLNGVSCPSVKLCFAVGSSSTGSGSKTLVERWNGKNWSIFPTPNPSPSVGLNAVTCVSASSCVAVGTSGRKTLVARWNGKGWAIVASPSRNSATNTLSGVSCTSATSCFAVGDSGTKTLVERWNGKTWSIVASPNRGSSALRDVSCPGAKSCLAVGILGNGTTLVERWNGKTWSIVASPSVEPADAGYNDLTGVSCPSAKSCTAVGVSGSFIGPGSSTLVERWNGTKWSIVATSVPPGATTSELNGVSCRSVTTCFAAGDYRTATSGYTLIERYK